ncbi:MAG: glucuronokinase [Actinomycetota bacterium]|jgi:glucuronokinase
MQRARVPARAGLAGNPSDAYGGAAVAVPIPGLAATVEVHDAPTFAVAGPADGRRLIEAAVRRMARRAGREDDTFEVRWTTTIPREVGLAGSSALIIAAMQALCARWDVAIPPIELAHVALAVEVEDLGIAAGIMDRAVQAFGVPVLVDGDGARSLVCEPMPRLVIAWSSSAAAPSHQVHGPLRARFHAGEADVVGAMDRLAAVARAAAQALEHGDVDALAECVRTTYFERVGLGVVGPELIAMVDALETIGVAATSAGSGGAVVGVLPDDMPEADARAALSRLCDGVTTLG